MTANEKMVSPYYAPDGRFEGLALEAGASLPRARSAQAAHQMDAGQVNQHRVILLLRALTLHGIIAQNCIDDPVQFNLEMAILRANMAALEEELKNDRP